VITNSLLLKNLPYQDSDLVPVGMIAVAPSVIVVNPAVPANNMAEFILQPQGDSTVVTWAIYGPSPFISKLMGVFMNIDTMVGKEFETGLAKLKAQMEK